MDSVALANVECEKPMILSVKKSSVKENTLSTTSSPNPFLFTNAMLFISHNTRFSIVQWEKVLAPKSHYVFFFPSSFKRK